MVKSSQCSTATGFGDGALFRVDLGVNGTQQSPGEHRRSVWLRASLSLCEAAGLQACVLVQPSGSPAFQAPSLACGVSPTRMQLLPSQRLRVSPLCSWGDPPDSACTFEVPARTSNREMRVCDPPDSFPGPASGCRPMPGLTPAFPSLQGQLPATCCLIFEYRFSYILLSFLPVLARMSILLVVNSLWCRRSQYV